MWYKFLIGIIIVTGFGENLYSQETIPRKNSLSIEVLGRSESFFALNYERCFFSSENKLVRWNFLTGYGFLRARHDTSYHHSIPVELNTIIGREIHFAEIGIGFVPTFNNSSLTSIGIAASEKSNYYYHYTFRFGYRIVAEGNIFGTISVIPTLRPVIPGGTELFYTTSFGFSLGYSW